MFLSIINGNPIREMLVNINISNQLTKVKVKLSITYNFKLSEIYKKKTVRKTLVKEKCQLTFLFNKKINKIKFCIAKLTIPSFQNCKLTPIIK